MNYHRLAALTLFLAYLVIVLGAATRVFDAGMSCPDWPTCYGVWNPFHPTAAPLGGYVVNGHTYSVGQVALEWSHRLLAMLTGIGLLVLLVQAPWRSRHEWPSLAAAVLLLLVQVKLGAITVWFGNVNWSVALHLGTAMLLFAALVTHRRAAAAGPGPYKAGHTPATITTLLYVTAATVWLLMVVGAFVSSSHAGGLCGGLFACDGAWLPADPLQAVHMLHRYLALLVFGLSIALLAVAKRQAMHLQSAASAFHLMVLVQVAIGIATLYSFGFYAEMYPYLSLLHLAWGTLVWMVIIGTLLNLRYGKAGRAHA